MTILLWPQELRREIRDPGERIVIPTGAPKERSGGTCGFPPVLRRLSSSYGKASAVALLENQTDGQEAQGEKGGQRGLDPAVVESGQDAV
jgi:hypothetical protein